MLVLQSQVYEESQHGMLMVHKGLILHVFGCKTESDGPRALSE